MAKLKVGRNIFEVTDNDLILDNGACYQIITKEVGTAFDRYPPLMSKKLFSELKKCGLVFTNEALKQNATKQYGSSVVTYYKFDIQRMEKLGY